MAAAFSGTSGASTGSDAAASTSRTTPRSRFKPAAVVSKILKQRALVASRDPSPPA